MSPVEIERCTGHCCRAFVVPSIAKAGGLEAFRALTVPGVDPRYDCDDTRAIAAMLIDLGRTATIDPLTTFELDPPQPLFGCSNFGEATGDCRIYATRPRMCSEYPYDRDGCKALGCTRKVRKVEAPAELVKAPGALSPIEVADSMPRAPVTAEPSAVNVVDAAGRCTRTRG
jgi:Fe-S-cluster containining protein